MIRQPVQDIVNTLAQEPTATFPRPEGLCSTDEDIEETTRTASGTVVQTLCMFWGEEHSVSVGRIVLSSCKNLLVVEHCCVTRSMTSTQFFILLVLFVMISGTIYKDRSGSHDGLNC